MIFRIKYISDQLLVVGYLAFPNDLLINKQDLYSLPMITEIEQKTFSIQKQMPKDKLPGFIYCRGGIGKIGKVKESWLEQFANEGYIIFAPSYRGNEESEGRDEFGGSDVNDVINGYHILSALPFVDTNDISIMGFSRGSINATKAAVELPSIRSLILWSGVTSLMQTYEERVDLRKMLKRVIGGSPGKVHNSYLERSPIEFVEKISCPVLIIHGTKDKQVSFHHGSTMYEELSKQSKAVTFHIYENEGHHFSLVEHLSSIKKMFDWIRTL